MQSQIRAFSDSKGLPRQFADELEVFIRQLVQSGAVDESGEASRPAGSATVSASSVEPAEPGSVAGRYEDLGPIGEGGMGEVRRVRDVALNRTLAMKTLRPALVSRPAARVRFLEEAQATAQLQHPNILPVHDIGTLPDGRVWFTMKEVQGRTLQDVVAEVHAASGHRWETGVHGWTFRRIMNAFLSVCRAVAHAHERGVVHRDLTPRNVMVGSLGETYVLDWGLAKVLGRAEGVADGGAVEPVQTSRGASDEYRTQMGRAIGTPAYMPPEQARGALDEIDERSDVYALGAILYEILSSRPPYQGDSAAVLLHQVVHAPPLPVGRATPVPTVGVFSLLEDEGPSATRSGPPLPSELVEACERAMSREPADRYQRASELAEVVEAWLDGARRREQALAMTERALAREAEVEALMTEAAALRIESESLLQGIEPWRPEEDKAPGWTKAKEAEEAERAAALKRLEVDQGLHGALQLAPGLEEAHAALVDRYRARHAEAEVARDREAAARAKLRLATHSAALPDDHSTRLACARYLKGDGALTLLTDPPGAEVLIYRYVERNRRLVPVFERSLGTTPLTKVALPLGSYSCILRHPGRADVRYPVAVPRLGHWDGVPPGADEPRPVWLPPEDHFGPDEIYVPAGWFQAGGDPEAFQSFPSGRRWVDAFVMQRFSVTNRQYLDFLDDLVKQGREDEALVHVPRERIGTNGEPGAMLYERTDAGGFALQTDADGDTWQPEWPVIHVDWHGAVAYLAWRTEQTGRPWRLPDELEWEKAARGVDGRWFPWGDHLDPSWCCISSSHRGRVLPAVVDSFPVDVSPFGVRGVGGGVRNWCRADIFASGWETMVADRSDPSGGPRRELLASRGGAWSMSARYARCANRMADQPLMRLPFLGFRGCFAVEGR